MKYRMETIIGAALALLGTPGAFTWADIPAQNFLEPEEPDTTPLLVAGLLFVLLVSGASFALLRRMARKRTAIGTSQKDDAENHPASEPET